MKMTITVAAALIDIHNLSFLVPRQNKKKLKKHTYVFFLNPDIFNQNVTFFIDPLRN